MQTIAYIVLFLLGAGLIISGPYLFTPTARDRGDAERKRVTPLTIFFRALWLAAAKRWWW
jgi:hypothetical protein